MKADTQTILSLHKKVVTHNQRIRVTHDEPKTWNLYINKVSIYIISVHASCINIIIICILIDNIFTYKFVIIELFGLTSQK